MTPEHRESAIAPGAAALTGCRVAGAIAAVVGGIWSAFWLTGLAARWSAAGAITPKTNMALGQLAAGVALLLVAPASAGGKRRLAGAVLAAIVFLIGALTLSEHLFGLDLRIDELVAREAPGAAATVSPNRMGPPGSLSLLLLGAGLLALAWRRRRAARYLGLSVCIVNLVPAVGFLYGAEELYGRPAVTGIAWPTVVALVSMGAGLILAQSTAGPIARFSSPDRGGALLRRTLPAVVLVPLMLGYLLAYSQSHRLLDAAMGTGLLVITLILVFSLVLWLTAAELSHSTAAEAEAHRATVESEVRLKQAQRVADLGSWEWDIETGALWWSEETYRLMGELPGRFTPSYDAFWQRIHPEDRPAFDTAIQHALAGRTPYDFEFRIVRCDGVERVLHSRGEIVGLVDGSRRMIGVCLDITGRTQAERRLRESEALLRDVIDTIPDPIYVKDAESRLMLVNQATVAIVGKPLEEIVGHTDCELYEDASVGQAILDHDRYVLQSGTVQVVEETVPTPAGSRVVLNTKAPRRDGSGHIVGLVGVGRDITERKRAEEAQLAANAQLREADRQKNEFLAILSHELRNPLAPIRNSLYILEHVAPGEAQARRALQVIDRQVAHLSGLVNDLLDITRITRGKVQLQLERLDLNEVVRRTVEDNRSLFETAAVRLEMVPAPAPVPVRADGTRIAQIVGNLLHNAAKFAHSTGRTRVSVSVDAAEATVCVADDGVGMADETLERLFQPFMQADQTLDRSKGGLGLGLALVKSLAELHGGSISAQSDGLGKGAEFRLRLPLDGGPNPEPQGTPARVASTCRRVLVIEDNADAAESLQQALELRGHRVALARDGPGGVAKARDFRPHVVLCDIGLPGIDGYAVARVFRADAALQPALLVALTGYASPGDLARAREAGFDHHLPKPPDLDKLAQILADSVVEDDDSGGLRK